MEQDLQQNNLNISVLKRVIFYLHCIFSFGTKTSIGKSYRRVIELVRYNTQLRNNR